MDIQGLLIVFFIAVLTGMGVGSGGLLIIYLTTFHALGQLQAQSINLVFFAFSAGASLLWHYTHRRAEPRHLLPIAAGGIAGSFLGSRLAAVTEPELLSSAFGILLTVSGTLTLWGAIKEKIRKTKEKKHG